MCTRIFKSFAAILPLLCAGSLAAQVSNGSTLAPNQITPPTCSIAPEADALPSLCVPSSASNQLEDTPRVNDDSTPKAIIDLVLPAGTALRISINERTRIAKIGAPVRGVVTDPVYAFDECVIPAGSIATGQVTKIDDVSRIHRLLAYTNGNFSPFHQYEVTFDTLKLPDGRELPIQTAVSPGTADIVKLVSHTTEQKQKSVAAKAAQSAKQEAKGKIAEAKQQANDSWEAVRSPGRLERVKRLLLAQSPYRRQYLASGTNFNADLQQSIPFGQIERSAAELSEMGSALVPDTTLKARLIYEVNSATAVRGNEVNAVVTAPVYSPHHRLILPVNSRIVGEVVQSQAARKFHQNGELRVIFQRIELPAEAQLAAQKISEPTLPATHTRTTGNLESVEVDKRARMTLDEEGGAHTSDSKTRYLSTGLAIMLAAAAAHPDAEHGTVDGAGDPGLRTAAGESGFRLVGAAISLAAKSSPLSIAFSVYGASSSVYTNFLSRGHEVVFPKDTPLEIGFGSGHAAAQTQEK